MERGIGTRDRNEGLIICFLLSQQRLGGGEGAEVDAVAAAAGEFLVGDVGDVGEVGGDEIDQNLGMLGPV